MKALTTTVARILFALPFGIFGVMHLFHANDMAGMVPLPGGVFWIYFTGLALISASVAIIIRKYDQLAGLLLAVMLLIFIVTLHIPGLGKPEMHQMAMMNLLKDTALMGGALTYAGLAKDDMKI